MDYYSITLNAIRKLLLKVGKDKYADVVSECIEKWETEKDCDMFRREFDKNGRFADFRLDSSNISDPEKGLWTGQLFSALVAMSAQTAFLIGRGKDVDINDMRRTFGAANEIMYASRCSSCGALEATASDLDKYVSKIVIARKVVDGLEACSLDETVDSITELTAPEIQRERRKAKTRLENSRIPYTDAYGRAKSCLKCGSKNIAECKLLKSLNENIFIPLKS